MHHGTPLIATIAAGLVLAFAFGMIVGRLRVSPLIGYLLAGVVVGPHTPGYVADQELSRQIAEIGVILLMFGVGIHFSLKELLAVKHIAIPGAIIQIAVAAPMGMGLSALLGWSFGNALIFSLALAVSSTVVLLRAFEERNLVDTRIGRIAIGWLIVEDLITVIALVLLPAMAGLLGGGEHGGGPPIDIATTLGITLLKVAAFVAIMLIFGRRFIPWLLEKTAATGSRELFTLAVLAIALGAAFGSATLFGVSFALGAFFAGMILNESRLSHQAAEDSLPLRDAFAVLFFVSVGMLFNPQVLIEAPLAVLATLAIITVGRLLVAYAIIRLFKCSRRTAMAIAAGRAQIGEFSFILAALGIDLQLLNERAQDLLLAGAILSILLNPVVFYIGRLIVNRGEDRKPQNKADSETAAVPQQLNRHTVLVGSGRVGYRIAESFSGRHDLVVIELNRERAEELRGRQFNVIHGNATKSSILTAAGIQQAGTLLIAIPNGFEAGNIVTVARRLNPVIDIIARANMDEEIAHLYERGADLVIMGEHEIAHGMFSRTVGAVENADNSTH